MLSAFLDESGTNPETPVLSVAGFYGYESQWERFRKLWKPVSNGFHAKDSTGLFPDLCAAIEASEVNGFLITIGKETYRVHASAQIKTGVGNAYSVCALLCIQGICRHVSNRPVSFVIEQGQPNLQFVNTVLHAMIDTGGSCVASVTIAKKSDFIELHTADFVSHVASSYDKKWMKRLFDAGRLVHGHVTQKSLEDTAPEIKALIASARKARKEAKRTR